MQILKAVTVIFILTLSWPVLASAAGPFPEIQVLGPGCEAAGVVPAGGVLRVTFQNVAQSCAGGRCSKLVDAPLDASKMTVKHGDVLLEAVFKLTEEKCDGHPVWAFESPIPGEGSLILSTTGLSPVHVPIREAVPGKLVLDYGDFGPQAAAHTLLGSEWWQWQPHGDSDPATRYDIKVVVFRKVKREYVEGAHPVEPDKQKDYRYITYDAAMKYLDGGIAENVLPAVTARLKATRDRLRSAFGKVTSDQD